MLKFKLTKDQKICIGMTAALIGVAGVVVHQSHQTKKLVSKYIESNGEIYSTLIDIYDMLDEGNDAILEGNQTIAETNKSIMKSIAKMSEKVAATETTN